MDSWQSYFPKWALFAGPEQMQGSFKRRIPVSVQATQMAIFRGPAMEQLNRVCRWQDVHYLVLLSTGVAVIMTLTGTFPMGLDPQRTKQEESMPCASTIH